MDEFKAVDAFGAEIGVVAKFAVFIAERICGGIIFPLEMIMLILAGIL